MEKKFEQRSKEWFLQRMGVFTSSEIGKLIGKGRAKDAIFSQVGQTYINEKKVEAIVKARIESGDIIWSEYEYRTQANTRATQWGEDHEKEARELVAIHLNRIIKEAYFITNPEFEQWGDSADGLLFEDETGRCLPIEIKCPYTFGNSFKLMNAVTAENPTEALKDADSDYFWQVVSHCICHNVEKCLFIVYDPFLANLPAFAWIEPSEEDRDTLKERVQLAITELNKI